ncbi:MAG: DNA-binding protein [Candidatus Pelethousia sp.]|nr:DNA-binding protein [Candidatus Pelethousia sp.]
MDYMTPKEAAIQWGISERRIQLLCTQERISGAIKFGRVWAIPLNAQKPSDLRKNQPVNNENDS